jgi:hypothetical protein
MKRPSLFVIFRRELLKGGVCDQIKHSIFKLRVIPTCQTTSDSDTESIANEFLVTSEKLFK